MRQKGPQGSIGVTRGAWGLKKYRKEKELGYTHLDREKKEGLKEFRKKKKSSSGTRKSDSLVLTTIIV